MKFVGLYPISEEAAEKKGEHLGEINFFLAVFLLIIYDLLGPLVTVGFYYWDKRLKEGQGEN
ncbi:hypothetical protein FD12_GL001950 [Lentilactobacillus rapi DSM 19907 = JCM 15042]|nr:hypothetical protein FD12_GL001950 [Lentilactobacillus rapi DSM 19907 = JCM 15042]